LWKSHTMIIVHTSYIWFIAGADVNKPVIRHYCHVRLFLNKNQSGVLQTTEIGMYNTESKVY